jgi:hypothetical protein
MVDVRLPDDLRVLRVRRPKHLVRGVVVSLIRAQAVDPLRDDGQSLHEVRKLVGANHRILPIRGAEMDVRSGCSAVGVASEPTLAF